MDDPGWEASDRITSAVRPVLDAFCERHGFAYVNKYALGRYPRVRIDKQGPVTLWFDLWMELDENGRRYEPVNDELPFMLSAGTHAHVADGSKHGARIQKAVGCFRGKPIREVATILEEELERTLRTIQAWDVQYLRDHGKTIQL